MHNAMCPVRGTQRPVVVAPCITHSEASIRQVCFRSVQGTHPPVPRTDQSAAAGLEHPSRGQNMERTVRPPSRRSCCTTSRSTGCHQHADAGEPLPWRGPSVARQRATCQHACRQQWCAQHRARGVTALAYNTANARANDGMGCQIHSNACPADVSAARNSVPEARAVTTWPL